MIQDLVSNGLLIILAKTGGTIDADINAPQAWDYTMGDADITVAVIDSGVDKDHPDLVERITTGYDFENDTPDADDWLGHGSHVAGIIAATTNNAEGTAGIAGNVTIMPLRIYEDSTVIGAMLICSRIWC